MSIGWSHGTYKTSFQLVQTPCVFLDSHACFLLTLTFETISSMYSFFLALVLFPEVQGRAQAELDVVIGRERLPTFDDRPRLPYIEALCKELMRWQMVTPMGTIRGFPWMLWTWMTGFSGLPHSSTSDDVYRGFFIPKGIRYIVHFAFRDVNDLVSKGL
jgi:hypothetical protein